MILLITATGNGSSVIGTGAEVFLYASHSSSTRIMFVIAAVAITANGTARQQEQYIAAAAAGTVVELVQLCSDAS